MNKLKQHEEYHTPLKVSWLYYCMDRGLKDKPLTIWFHCLHCKSTIVNAFDADLHEINLVNKHELHNDLKLVENHKIENVFRIHPKGRVISMTDRST